MCYRQDAFGAPTSGTLEPYNTQLLTEKGFDTDSGLYYFGSRWYDPANGRFMNQDAYRGSASSPMTQHRYSYVHNNPANLVDEWGYNAEWAPQPHNVAIDGLIANVSGGGSMFVNFSQQLAGRVGTRIGGIASGVFDGVVGAGQWAVAHPWESAGIAVAAAAAIVAIVMTAPVSVPAILSAAGTIESNMAIGQGIALAAGVARDAADIVNPSLGTLVGYAQTGVQVFNAVTSLASGVGTLASVDPSNLVSLFSTQGADALSSVLGNASSLAGAVGVDVPGLGLASTVIGYASMGAKLGGLGSKIVTEPINYEATGTVIAPMKPGRSQAEVDALMASARQQNAASTQSMARAGQGPYQVAFDPATNQQLIQNAIYLIEQVGIASDALTAAGVVAPVPPPFKLGSVAIGIGGKLASKVIGKTHQVVEKKMADDVLVGLMKAQAKNVWGMADRPRGVLIENLLAKTDYKDWTHVGKQNNGFFPLFDFLHDSGIAVSLKSVNTKGGSWMNDMKNHILDLKNAGATIEGKSANLVLDLRVQPGGARDAAKLIDFGRRNGVNVKVSEF